MTAEEIPPNLDIENCHCERSPEPNMVQGEVKQSDTKCHSERSEESR